VAFAAERALDFVGNSALLTENANRDSPVSVLIFMCRNFHDFFQITVSIGGTACVVEPPFRKLPICIDGSLW